MSPDRWSDTERLFQAATALSPAERTRYLAAACADAELRAEVEALLAVHDRPGVLDAPLGLTRVLADVPGLDLPTGVAPPDDGLAPGARVGPYRIVRELGRGGMGRVYLAERADGGFAQTVALKLVRPDAALGRAGVRERFLRERALLAGLEHPAIARLLDGGQTPAGEPFFALEPVDGAPITDAADRERLDVRARLQLFLQVCDAVAYAHRRLVAHRDLKPSNVLVARGADGRLQAKLLDFGVAALLDAPGDARAEQPFTPDYAAPEQVRGEAAGTAADVWALGVLLHRLLAGRRPFRFEDRHRDALLATLAAGAEPPSRSAVRPARDGEAAADAVAAARATTPARLGRVLAGDLDAVVLKALRPEPEARYASVDALADDLRRHLDGRAVLARGGGARYRAGRFVRRHRWGVGVTAAALVALALGLALLAAQTRRAVRERDRARQIAGVLESVFLDIDPGSPAGAATSLRDVLATGTARVSALDASPDVQAHLLDVLARVYRALADYDRALPLHRAAVAAAVRAHGPDAPETLRARHHLAYLLDLMGQPDEASRLYRAVLAARRRTDDADGLVESLGDLAGFELGQDRPDAAAAAASEGLAVLRRHPTAGPPDLGGPLARAGFLSILARTDETDGRDSLAEARLREALAIYTRVRGAEHTYTASAETGLGAFLARHGGTAEAERLVRHAVAVQTRAWGPDHPWTTAALVTQADVRARAGDAPEARRLLALARQRAAADSVHAADVERRAARVEAVMGQQPD